MSQHEITINLNDVSTQTFDAQGNSTGASNVQLTDPDLVRAYEEMVSRFEEVISNSPEGMASAARRQEAEDMEIELRRVMEDGTEVSSSGSPPSQPPQPPAPPYDPFDIFNPGVGPSPTGSGPVPPSGGGGGGGGGGAFPPGGGIVNPPGGGGGGGGGPSVGNGTVGPPVPPGGGGGGGGGAGGAAGAAGAAAMGGGIVGDAAIMMGPAGIALFAVVGVFESLILAGEGLVQVFEALDDMMESLVQDTRSYSADVATEAALREVNNIVINMDRAMKLGPDIARWIESRTELDTAMGDLATDVARDLIPLAKISADAATQIVALLNLSYEYWRDVIQSLDLTTAKELIAGSLPLIGPGVTSLVASVEKGIREYREQKERERLASEAEIFEDFKNFLDQNAIPMRLEQNRLANLPQVPVVGGGLP